MLCSLRRGRKRTWLSAMTDLTKVTKLDQRRSRDDAAAALLLAAGEQARRPAPVELRGAVISKSGEVTWL